MIKFSNEPFNESNFIDSDLFVCTIGSEERSYYILDKFETSLNYTNTLLFATDNYTLFQTAVTKIEDIRKKQYNLEVVKYQNNEYVLSKIVDTIKEKMSEKPAVSINIDYSSMPRGWYCKLPILLQQILRAEDRVYFWYSEGNYSKNYEEYPTAGIEAFNLFSGKPSLRVQKRAHVLALSYDAIRTQGIVSVIDPEYIIVCEAHDPSRDDIHKNIIEANENLMAQAAMSVSLDLSDFTFMLSKLREIANELVHSTDVIFVPDGPKPLIFAMSLIPDLLGQVGITCLHVMRNYVQFKPVDVIASGKVVGFSIQANEDAFSAQ